MGYLFRAAVEGILTSGTRLDSNRRLIPKATMDQYWPMTSRNLPKGIARPTPNTRRDFLNVNDRLFEILGSNTNRSPFRVLDKNMNGMKGRIFHRDQEKSGSGSNDRTALVSAVRFEGFITTAIQTGTDEEAFLEPMRMVSMTLCFISRFRTCKTDSVVPVSRRRWQSTATSLTRMLNHQYRNNAASSAHKSAPSPRLFQR